MGGNGQANPVQWTLGLDIGIASVGWAALAPDRIIGLGVRAFDKAETAKEGESLNLARRQARLMRRRLWRRAWRLTKLGRLLRREGLITSANFLKSQPGFANSPWQLRVAGLDQLLTPEEWARVIYHLCKHRGFHWVSKAEQAKAEGDTKGEGGRVKAGLADSDARMKQEGYRTAAEMLLAEFPQAQRNKQGNYDKALSRVLLDSELALLFEAQRRVGNPHASNEFENLIRGSDQQRGGLFWEQRPIQSVVGRMGKCTFEKAEDRAPKASFSAERHVWMTRLNNLRINDTGQIRPLSNAERAVVIDLPYRGAEKLTYKNLRKKLVDSGLLSAEFRFNGLSYPSNAEQDASNKAKDPEDQALIKMPAWHELRTSLRKQDLESEWNQIATPALEGKPDTLDQVAWVLSVYKNDQEIDSGLSALNLPGGEKTVAALLGIRFDKFHALSLKALRKIVPHMERGLRYDEAVAQVPEYGHHSQRTDDDSRTHKFLPPLYAGRNASGTMLFRDDLDVPRNPVVLRALNQARKVVNALIKLYGAPTAVHIEMARDLSRPLDERRDIEKLQTEYRDRNAKQREHFFECFARPPTGAEFEKWQLYKEQDGKCAYSLNPLDIERVLNDGSYAQVDHALPYSRSFDNGKNNKVLVLAVENQSKGNRTPYEYLDGQSDNERWRAFSAWVQANKNYRQAKRSRLLRKNYGPDEASGFRDRNLIDTRYICRFFKNYVEGNLKLADDSTARRCVVVNGQLTAFLRARWGLHKSREESDRHHALDAVVVAACGHGMVKRLADHARKKELEYLREGFADPETGEVVNPQAHRLAVERFPEPWPLFRREVELRLKTDDQATLRSEIERLGTYPAEALRDLRPLFVSRAPQRRNGGAAHKDTIYGQSESQRTQGSVTQKIPLTALTLKDLDRLADPHRNEKLYAAIRKRLEEHGGKGEKAFATDTPLFKPDRQGNPSGPLVRSVTVMTEKMSGIPIRGGVAKNDTMLRVDVFTKGGKFHLVPVYVHHRVKGLPNRAIVAFKDEADWTLIDDSFEFAFSLHPNDLVKVTQKGKAPITGYFGSCHRGTGAFNLWTHDRSQHVGKNGAIDGIGVKLALNVEKFHVDVLGNIYMASHEGRHGLA